MTLQNLGYHNKEHLDRPNKGSTIQRNHHTFQLTT